MKTKEELKAIIKKYIREARQEARSKTNGTQHRPNN